MTRLILLLAVALFAGGISACSLGDVPPGTTAPQPGRGIVILSLGRTGSVDFDLWLRLRPVGGKFRNMVLMDSWLHSRDWRETVFKQHGVNRLEYADTAKPMGRMAVLELPPGAYEFYAWQGDTRAWPRSAREYSLTSGEFSAQFTVREGSVTYLGGLVLEMPSEIPLAFFRDKFRLKVTKEPDKDLPILRRKFPALADSVSLGEFANGTAVIEGEYYLQLVPELPSRE